MIGSTRDVPDSILLREDLKVCASENGTIVRNDHFGQTVRRKN